MEFTGAQKSMTFKQINNAKPEIVFPLLCPVREKDWIDGWDYKMIFSKSGLIEKSCVFSTSHNGNVNTIWYVTEYDKKNFRIEFLRITANEEIVKININLKDNGNKPRHQKLHINIQDSMKLKIHGYIIDQRVSLEQVWFCGKNQLITI